jgi:predicted small lipoprotein YifL
MRNVTRVLAAFVLCGMLAACGARGSLEAPSGAPRQPPDQPSSLDPLL